MSLAGRGPRPGPLRLDELSTWVRDPWWEVSGRATVIAGDARCRSTASRTQAVASRDDRGIALGESCPLPSRDPRFACRPPRPSQSSRTNRSPRSDVSAVQARNAGSAAGHSGEEWCSGALTHDHPDQGGEDRSGRHGERKHGRFRGHGEGGCASRRRFDKCREKWRNQRQSAFRVPQKKR